MPDIHDTLNERGKVHGDYAKQAARSEAILNEIMQDATHDMGAWHDMSAFQRQALTMIAVKLGRIMIGDPNEPDHWRDISGYATLVLDRLTKDPDPK